MQRRTWAAAVISATALLLLGIEALSWSHSARFGPQAATTLRCAVRLDALSDADRAAGLRPADVVQLRSMDVPSRVAQVFRYTPTQAGRAGQMIRLVLARDGRVFNVPYLLRHTDPWTTFAAQMAFKLFLLGIAALLLWRGSDGASLLLGIWCTSVGLALPDAWWGALSPPWRIAGGALTALLWTASPFVLYLVVEYIAKGVSKRAKYVARACMALLIVPSIIINVVDTSAQAIGGCSLIELSEWITSAAFASSQLVIIAFFALSYVRTTGLDKQRVRWVFWAFLISRAGVLVNLLNRLLEHPIHLSGLEWVTVLIFPIGCTYAILRHRIIDVNFVLNRTLVFTIVTSFLVGLFILIEDLLKSVEASRGVGIAVELCTALAIGFSFNRLHKYVEGLIERALFRAKHEAASALRRLADEAPFMESADALLARTVQEVCREAGASGVAIYERVEDEYSLSASAGSDVPPSHVGIDDLAFVRMRKARAPVNLGDVTSALGSAGVAFPCTVRGALTGAVICRPRPNGEAYAPDELALLSAVAHEVGAEVGAIRARRQSELLDALLAGKLDIPEARERFRTV